MLIKLLFKNNLFICLFYVFINVQSNSLSALYIFYFNLPSNLLNFLFLLSAESKLQRREMWPRVSIGVFRIIFLSIIPQYGPKTHLLFNNLF